MLVNNFKVSKPFINCFHICIITVILRLTIIICNNEGKCYCFFFGNEEVTYFKKMTVIQFS